MEISKTEFCFAENKYNWRETGSYFSGVKQEGEK